VSRVAMLLTSIVMIVAVSAGIALAANITCQGGTAWASQDAKSLRARHVSCVIRLQPVAT
jgi:hypothetical protein